MSYQEPIICISTQLIEAGVDLDFDRVIRSYAGIDSIVQASGRCNREGRRERGIVQLVGVDNNQENVSYLKSVKDKKEITEQITAELSSPMKIGQLNDEFFERYFSNSKEDDLNYPLGKDEPTVYDLLSTNEMNNVKQVALKQSFKEAGIKMDLIQDNSKGVIVYYDADEDCGPMIEELIDEIEAFQTTYDMNDLEKIKYLLDQLQPYTINMRVTDERQNALMNYMGGEVLILQQDLYDDEIGMVDSMNEFIL